jgi:hypothetical protein
MRTLNRERVDGEVQLQFGSNVYLFTDGTDLGDKYLFRYEKETDKAICLSVENVKHTYSKTLNVWVPKSILKSVGVEKDGNEFCHLYIIPMWYKNKNEHYFKHA